MAKPEIRRMVHGDRMNLHVGDAAKPSVFLQGLNKIKYAVIMSLGNWTIVSTDEFDAYETYWFKHHKKRPGSYGKVPLLLGPKEGRPNDPGA